MMTEIAMLAVGLAVGGVTVWLILKEKIRASAHVAKGTAEVELASLNATLQAKKIPD